MIHHRNQFLLPCVLAAVLSIELAQTQAAIVIGPWLEGDNTTNVDVLVECDSATPVTINFGATTNYGSSAVTAQTYSSTSGADIIHRIKLKGLQANTLYYYQVTDQGAPSADYHFSTAPSQYAITQAPPQVDRIIRSVAAGRAIEKLEKVTLVEVPWYRAYIADRLGPQLLTVDGNGHTVDNAVVVPFCDMPQAVRNSAKSAVAGRPQVCRKSLVRTDSSYVVDYLINEDEPVYAVILEAQGAVRAAYGYNESDED